MLKVDEKSVSFLELGSGDQDAPSADNLVTINEIVDLDTIKSDPIFIKVTKKLDSLFEKVKGFLNKKKFEELHSIIKEKTNSINSDITNLINKSQNIISKFSKNLNSGTSSNTLLEMWNTLKEKLETIKFDSMTDEKIEETLNEINTVVTSLLASCVVIVIRETKKKYKKN